MCEWSYSVVLHYWTEKQFLCNDVSVTNVSAWNQLKILLLWTFPSKCRDGTPICSYCDTPIDGTIKITIDFPPMYSHPGCFKVLQSSSPSPGLNIIYCEHNALCCCWWTQQFGGTLLIKFLLPSCSVEYAVWPWETWRLACFCMDRWSTVMSASPKRFKEEFKINRCKAVICPCSKCF